MNVNYLCISCVTLNSGGAERVISVLTKSFVGKFDSIKIFMWLGNRVFYEIPPMVKIVSIEDECQSRNPIKKMFWFRKQIRKNPPSLILSFLARSSIQVILSTFGIRVPIVVAERNDPHFLRGGKAVVFLRDFLYNRAEGILQQTEVNKNYFKGRKREKTVVIYNPIFMDAEYVGKALRVTKENVVVSVGRLEPQKNFSLLIRAFSVFHQKHPNFKLVIYGSGSEKGMLQNLICDLDLNGEILLPGVVTNVLDCIVSAKMFVLPSNFEGMSNALIEAMCLGLPCISTMVSGSTELIQNKKNGILVDINNESHLIEAMNLLAENGSFADVVAHKASDIYKLLGVNRICDQWVDYLMSKMNI